jgi:hypothetical protein
MSDNKDLLQILSYGGIGDRLCDIIGSYIISKYLGLKLNVLFNPVIGIKHAWGNTHIFDIRLFDFNNENIKFFNNQNDYKNDYKYYIKIGNASSSSSPYNIYKFIKNFKKDISFEEIINIYCSYAREIIKPSKIIENNIPDNLNNSYGIHLRKTDKVNNKNNNNVDKRHLSNVEEFKIMSNALFNDICKIILTEDNPSFLLTSDENGWKEYFKNELLTFAKNNNKTISFIDVNYDTYDTYDNYNAILDLFCLSKCKKIFQGVKNSTYSNSAAIIGNNELINYSKLLVCYPNCLIQLYYPIIKNNNEIKYNIDYITEILTSCDSGIITNIVEKI